MTYELIKYLCNMISKATVKLIHSLGLKKNRDKEGLFVAEGPKVVADLLAVASPLHLIATSEWFAGHRMEKNQWGKVKISEVTEDELRKASFLKTPQQVIGVFPIPETEAQDTATDMPGRQLCLALDGVQDPGNLGTIIRIADWFGIEHVYCSEDTADAYNPKVVQATMGSIARVKVHSINLPQFITHLPEGVPIYGTLLDGQNIYTQELSANGLIVMGNEGKGISEEIRKLVTHKLFIPSFPPDTDTAESLNVAIATAITCAEFRRRIS